MLLHLIEDLVDGLSVLQDYARWLVFLDWWLDFLLPFGLLGLTYLENFLNKKIHHLPLMFLAL